jgi:hypothetical protein
MSLQVNGWRPLFFLLLLVAGILFLTLPREVYRGDAVAIRGATLSLLQSGDLAINKELFEKNKELLIGQDQAYFVRNSHDGRYFSKWGFLNTLLYIPPVSLELLRDPEMPFMAWRGDFGAIVSTYNILWALGLTFYLWLLLGLFTKQSIVKIVYILGCLFASFLWNYLRAQTTEIFQVFFFVACTYHYFVWLGESRESIEKSPPKHLYAALVYAVCLSWLKPYFVLLLGALGLHALWFILRFKRRKSILSVATGIVVFGLFVLLLSHAYKFGSPFATGYGRTVHADLRNRFVGNVFDGLGGLLFSGNYSVFIHFPMLLFAVLGAKKFWSNSRNHYSFTLLVALVFFLFIGKMENWAGHWSYGPRYLLFLLPVLSLPALSFFSDVMTFSKNRRLFSATGILSGLFFCVWLQCQVNTLNFFIRYELYDEIFTVWAPEENALAYFEMNNFARINYDLLAFRSGEKPFFPLETVRLMLSQEQMDFLAHKVRSKLWINYYWFSD